MKKMKVTFNFCDTHEECTYIASSSTVRLPSMESLVLLD